MYQLSSVAQSCLTLCDPMDCSTPGLPVHQQLPELAPTHFSLSWWCHPTITSSVISFSSCLQSFSASGSSPMSQSLTSGGQGIGASALASVLPVNIQGWFPLGLTGLICLQSRGLSRVLSLTPHFKSINSLALSFPYSPTLTSIYEYWKNHGFD